MKSVLFRVVSSTSSWPSRLRRVPPGSATSETSRTARPAWSPHHEQLSILGASLVSVLILREYVKRRYLVKRALLVGEAVSMLVP